MAVTQGPRFGLYRWSAPGDPYTRVQQDANDAALETSAMGFIESTAALRPAAAAGNAGFLHRATDTGVFTYSTGAAWVELGGTSGFAKSFLTMG